MNDRELADLIGELRDVSPKQPGPEVRTRLANAFRARQRKRKPLRYYLMPLAASFAIAAALFFARPYLTIRKSGMNNFDTRAFVALPYAQSGVPMEQAVIVRMTIPAATLTSMGMTLSLPPQQRVDTELLVGQDGVARAARILQ
ncbi:MAG: hypothetical protein WA324_18440 [Bryobacteraceae bacterium]